MLKNNVVNIYCLATLGKSSSSVGSLPDAMAAASGREKAPLVASYTGPRVMKRALLFAGLLFVGSARLFGADLSGIWTGQTVDRNGDPQDVSFRFNQSGDRITGKMYGENESTPISEGKVDGDTIHFVVVTELNGQINRMIYSGRILSEKGDEIEITREREHPRENEKKFPPMRLRCIAPGSSISR
jgi:hypothetical protein